jgi:hypothetical protein
VARNYFSLQNKIIWIKNISIKKSDVGRKNSSVLRDFSAGHFNPIEFFFYLIASHTTEQCKDILVHHVRLSSNRGLGGDGDGGNPQPDYDKAYPDFCIPSLPPDLDCADINHKDFYSTAA